MPWQPDIIIPLEMEDPRNADSQERGFDLYDQYGNERRVWLPAHLSAEETINLAVEHIKANWPAMRDRFFRGLK